MKNNTGVGISIMSVVMIVLGVYENVQSNSKYSNEDINIYSGDTVWGISSEYSPECTNKSGYIHIVTADNTCTIDAKPEQKISVRAYEKKD